MQPPKNHDSVAGFCLQIGDETIALRRDVCHRHPQRVHDALETAEVRPDLGTGVARRSLHRLVLARFDARK